MVQGVRGINIDSEPETTLSIWLSLAYYQTLCKDLLLFGLRITEALTFPTANNRVMPLMTSF